jgi:hypothetical protein
MAPIMLRGRKILLRAAGDERLSMLAVFPTVVSHHNGSALCSMQ